MSPTVFRHKNYVGKSTSAAEVLDISRHGIWLFVKGREYLLPYEKFPWFARAKISDVYHVKLLHGSHLHWPALDVDLALESLEVPDQYPLVYRK